MSKYDEEILASLTDEERAALEEDEAPTNDADAENDDEDSQENADAGQASEDDGDDAKEGDDQDDAGDDAGDGAGDDASSGKDDAGQSNAKPTDTAAPLLVAEAPADAQERLKDIGDKKAELSQQFDDGDISAKEYQTGLDTLNKDERAVERAVEKAQLAAEMRQQQEVNTWLGQVRDFTTNDHPEYGSSRVRWMALDTFVKEIGTDKANAGMTGQEILRLAHERVVEDLGAAAPTKAAPKTGRPLKGSKAVPPKTLAKVPASDNADIESSRWSALDRLRDSDPLAHEDKLMKLSENERDEYLARG